MSDNDLTATVRVSEPEAHWVWSHIKSSFLAGSTVNDALGDKFATEAIADVLAEIRKENEHG